MSPSRNSTGSHGGAKTLLPISNLEATVPLAEWLEHVTPDLVGRVIKLDCYVFRLTF